MIRLSVSSNREAIIDSPDGVQKVGFYIKHFVVDLRYLFLERIEDSTQFKIHTLVLQSPDPDNKCLFFVPGSFLVPLIRFNRIYDWEEMDRVMWIHARKLEQGDDSCLREDLDCGLTALVTGYFLMNRVAETWQEGYISNAQLSAETMWLHIMDEMIESLVRRHGGKYPRMEGDLNAIQREFKWTLNELYDVHTGDVPEMSLKIAMLDKGDYVEALALYQPKAIEDLRAI